MLLTADPIFNIQLNQNNIVLITCIVTAILSIITSIITTNITSRKQYNNDVKKWILEKRASFYLELYKKIEIIMKDPQKVFDNDFFDMLVQVKPEVKLFASKRTFKQFQNFYNFVRNKRRKLKFYYKENDPFNAIEVYYDDDGLEQYSQIPSQDDVDEFNHLLVLYKEENAPKVNEAIEYVNILCQAMRVDLGSNIK